MGVIIEYLGKHTMRIVGSAAERRAIVVAHTSTIQRMAWLSISTDKSANTERSEHTNHTTTGPRCWKNHKRGQPHAHRGWQRHPCKAG